MTSISENSEIAATEGVVTKKLIDPKDLKKGKLWFEPINSVILLVIVRGVRGVVKWFSVFDSKFLVESPLIFSF
jgi:hypothetical protein